MQDILQALARGEDLSEETAGRAMHAIMDGAATPAQMAAYLTLLRTKGETIAELTGSARAMRDHALPVPGAAEDAIDTCGTGGDGAGTFNISTAAAFIVAAAGVPVAKHGNRAASSKTGSADVLQALGVAIDLPPEQAARSLRESGFCFLFAQAYHPAMKHVAPVRRELGFRTMFNILGPLTNPARPRRQVLGTPDTRIAQKMAHVLAALGCERALVVHAQDGLDEISVAAKTDVFELKDGEVVKHSLAPENFGLPRHPLTAIAGGDPEDNAHIIQAVLDGEKGARRDVVVMNAAAALYVSGRAAALDEAARLAERLLDGGVVAAKLEQVARLSRTLAEGVSA